MKQSTKSMSSIVILGKEASQSLDRILSEPPTAQQKKSFSQSVGVYSSYQQKWQKKK